MTYQSSELSTHDGRPVELFKFSYSGQTWYYTNADKVIVHDAQTYVPESIARNAIKSSADVNKANVTIMAIDTLPVAQLFVEYPPSEPVIVTIFGRHLFDDSMSVIWKGRIMGAAWKEGSMIELTSESVFTSLQRPGLGRTFQTQCPYALYGAQCGVSQINHRHRTTVTGIVGREVSLLTWGKPAQWADGGLATWSNNAAGNIEKRAIRSSSTDGKIVLAASPVGLSVGDTIDVFAGCDHTLNGAQGCTQKFNNHIRFGGMPWTPSKNPFGGNTLF